MELVVAGLFLVFVISLVTFFSASPEKQQEMMYGRLNARMRCPHCDTSGQVRTKPVTQKKGVSGGKATAAVLTGGISLLATGLSRKENNTQARCGNCDNTWCF